MAKHMEERLVPLDHTRGILYRGRPSQDGAIRWDDGCEVPLTEEDRLQLAHHPAPAVARPAPRPPVEDPWLRRARIEHKELQARLAALRAHVEADAPAVDARAQAEAKRRARAEEAQASALRATRAGVPQAITSALRGPFQDRPALQEVRRWRKSGLVGLLLIGASQAGKSFAAAQWLCSTTREGLFVSGPDLDLAVRPDAEGQGLAYLRRCRSAGALVLDEVASKLGTAALEQIDTLICSCFDQSRRLIITTNAPSQRHFFDLFGVGDRNRVEARFRSAGRIVEIGPWAGAPC